MTRYDCNVRTINDLVVKGITSDTVPADRHRPLVPLKTLTPVHPRELPPIVIPPVARLPTVEPNVGGRYGSRGPDAAERRYATEYALLQYLPPPPEGIRWLTLTRS